MNQTEIVQELNDQTFNFRIPQSLKKELTDRSQSTGKKPSAIVREAIKTYLFDNKAA
jgi:predicted DNA-binding protein